MPIGKKVSWERCYHVLSLWDMLLFSCWECGLNCGGDSVYRSWKWMMKINTLTFKHLDNGDDGCNEELVDWRTMQNIAQLLALISAHTLYFCNYHLNICPLAIFCLCRIFPIDTFIKIFCPISISSALQLNFCSAHYTSIARIAPFLVVRAPFLVLSAATFSHF